MEQQKIDFVIIWVDGSDPAWQAERAKYQCGATGDNSSIRFRDWDNLQFWFRGVEKFAPWVNRIHFVTCGHLPSWLNTAHPKLHLVKHSDYIDEEYLPTFNSHVIELNMHRIEGLSEQFVYFNDDTFLCRPMKRTDFFRDGLPCDAAILSPIIVGKGEEIGKIAANNMYVINSHFKKSDCISQSRARWLSPLYGKQLLRNIALMPWHHIPGFFNPHMPVPYLKRTLQEVWEAEPELLESVNRHRFRSYTFDVNQWLFRYWRLCKNEFVPRNMNNCRSFSIGNDNAELCKSISAQRYQMICMNDSEDVRDFEKARDEIRTAFQKILPEKSGFEK